jgi:hypothetical protein
MDVGHDRFWDDLEVADPLNQVIWDESVAAQLEIGPPEQLRAVNSIGAQQAMIEGTAYSHIPCLPWVPDLLATDWKAESAILIVGSAYAGFFSVLPISVFSVLLSSSSFASHEDFPWGAPFLRLRRSLVRKGSAFPESSLIWRGCASPEPA